METMNPPFPLQTSRKLPRRHRLRSSICARSLGTSRLTLLGQFLNKTPIPKLVMNIMRDLIVDIGFKPFNTFYVEGRAQPFIEKFHEFLNLFSIKQHYILVRAYSFLFNQMVGWIQERQDVMRSYLQPASATTSSACTKVATKNPPQQGHRCHLLPRARGPMTAS